MNKKEISLLAALNKQIEICYRENNYRCGVYVTSIEKKEIVMKVLSNLLYVMPNVKTTIIDHYSECFVKFDNGSKIVVLFTRNSVRGYRFNGAIVDKGISNTFYSSVICPMIVPLEFDARTTPYGRIDAVSVGYKDIADSQEIKNFNVYSMIDMFNETREFFKDEEEIKKMYNEYDRPIIDKEINGVRILLYEAWGIPKTAITHRTEFINKTKETFLNVVGEWKDESIGFENDINIRLHIDTDIYDSFEVSVDDGVVKIMLHEIEHEKPMLRDLSID